MSILDTATKVFELVKKAGNIEAQELVMTLRGEVVELQAINNAQASELQGLKRKSEIASQLEFDPPYYWLEKNEDRDGPFCQLCYDKDEKLIRLQKWGQSGRWKCLSCTSIVTDKSYVFPKLRSRIYLNLDNQARQ